MSIPTITDIAGITAQPDLRFTPSGKAVLSIRLAFNDSKYDEQSQKWVNTKTFYVDAQAWEQTAERLAEQLNQGDQVYVSGRLETQSWEKDGQKQSKPVLNLNAIRKLAKGEAPKQQGQRQPRTQPATQQHPDNTGGNGYSQADDPWATPGISNAGGWGNGPAPTDPPF